ncbi:MAG: rhodanese-like domain-containing protein [Pseudomonadota bacterium]|nr:rhodanese-like domain-containing protein [Pseudomonadota bacterium]
MALTKTAAQLVDEARARIEEVEAPDLIAALDDPDTVIVDIRDVRELQKVGRIPGSVHAPRGMLEFWVDPDSPYYREVFGQAGKRYVLHCASGWRSALAAAALNDMGFACAHLKGGFTAWAEADGPVEPKD